MCFGHGGTTIQRPFLGAPSRRSRPAALSSARWRSIVRFVAPSLAARAAAVRVGSATRAARMASFTPTFTPTDGTAARIGDMLVTRPGSIGTTRNGSTPATTTPPPPSTRRPTTLPSTPRSSSFDERPTSPNASTRQRLDQPTSREPRGLTHPGLNHLDKFRPAELTIICRAAPADGGVA